MTVRIRIFFGVLLLLIISITAFSQINADNRNTAITIRSGNRDYTFLPEFVVLYSSVDPRMALKPAGIKKVSYNVLTWVTEDSVSADFKQKKVGAEVAGDGFDDSILRSGSEQRTANVYKAGRQIYLKASGYYTKGDTSFFRFAENEIFDFTAYVLKKANPYPELHFTMKPKVKGYYSVGYIGAPAFNTEQVAELWQSLIWTEKRTPEVPYVTPAFMATLPTTMVNDGNSTVAVVAASQYLPFNPLPQLKNSQFGIALLNLSGKAQPQVFAPILGGANSLMQAGTSFIFSLHLVAENLSLTNTHEKIARSLFGFKDYRHNSIANLNTALDNLIDYSKSHYAWFIDSLKGFAYSTDVPGAVKNVSSLNPLEMAIVRDDAEMFEKRAYPLMEYMLSREKFLFSLDSTQKIQSPSRKLKGPIAPISELVALYSILGKQNDFYLSLANREFANSRIRNLDDKEDGQNWINAMHLFKMTSDTSYLNISTKLAKEYLQKRVYNRIKDFNDPMWASHFFWPTFTNHWQEFLELYELTGDTIYLKAAHDGARHYALFTWMVPAIPDSMITVNKGGKAPMYWYLKSKGHEQVYYPEEKAPAWRLSEIGLTPESSGTATGHRGIFMSCYAPWMLRVGYYTKDSFLMQIAKAAVVGRYTNFPGYHINTERTTAYEKTDFPLREHKKQSVNSFHYNHILPMASMMMDYLVSDAYVRSAGRIHFPSLYIEGYAYLQNKFYGHEKGTFYDYQNVQLWMPPRLLDIESKELNYISAYKGDTLLIAFCNQHSIPVASSVALNSMWVTGNGRVSVKVLSNQGNVTMRNDSNFTVTVQPGSITAIAIYGVKNHVTFQNQILNSKYRNSDNDFTELPEGNAKAMLIRLGELGERLFVYLEDDDNKWQQASLTYQLENRKERTLIKTDYPFEFTVNTDASKNVSFYLTLRSRDGKIVRSKKYKLGNMSK